jgi:hypothetical protein
MNTMRMPGFTAEASIYRSCARYSGDPTSELRRGEEGIIRPALWMHTFCERYGSVRICCIVWDGGQYCFESTVFWPFKLNEAPASASR